MPQRQRGRGGIRTPRLRGPVLRPRGPRSLQPSLRAAQTRPAPYPPAPTTWTGSGDEWAVYWALGKLGKRDGVDFEYQGQFAGGRQLPGGIVPDFVIYNPPNIAFDIQGEYWHYRKGTFQQARDRYQVAALAGYGITLILIDEQDALTDPVWVVREALLGIDHSKLKRMG